jgi:hypothetical protein
MKKILSVMLVSTAMATNLYAAETDQFYAKDAIIKDSSDVMNEYFHTAIGEALGKVNSKKNSVSCRQVAKQVLQTVLGEFSLIDYAKNGTFSKVSHFSQKSPEVDRFPEELEGGKYRKASIYKHRPFPTNVVGISKTLNINGIYIGTDKIGHFSIVGKTYYKNFLKGLDIGLSSQDAEDYAIKKGFKQEKAILGYLIGGTMAFGDLEANYQGLQFARNMCEGEDPYLIEVEGMWAQNPNHLFDIRKYINPKMDEAYNVSLWSPRVWKKMKNEIIPAYCANKINTAYLARKAYYDTIVTENHHDKMVAEFVRENPKFDREDQLKSRDIECNN